MNRLHPIPAFDDNYIWQIDDGRHALVVDPGDAGPVLAWLQQHQLKLQAVLLTHHHIDHTGGVDELRQATGARVWGPAGEALPEPAERLAGGDDLEVLGIRFEVLDVPGHTAGHIAYCAPDFDGAPLLFCGDTLFSGGCGRIFEGTPAQMLASLDRLSALPDDTRVCCAHEYTMSNLRFAAAVEPDNRDLASHTAQCRQWRDEGRPTLPSSIGLERRINPFLRSRLPAMSARIRAHAGLEGGSESDVFAALRAWKNDFR